MSKHAAFANSGSRFPSVAFTGLAAGAAVYIAALFLEVAFASGVSLSWAADPIAENLIRLSIAVRNHGADALWNLAFLSAMFWVWNFKIGRHSLPWFAAALFGSAIWETAQLLSPPLGTFDPADIQAGAAGCAAAMVLHRKKLSVETVKPVY